MLTISIDELVRPNMKNKNGLSAIVLGTIASNKNSKKYRFYYYRILSPFDNFSDTSRQSPYPCPHLSATVKQITEDLLPELPSELYEELYVATVRIVSKNGNNGGNINEERIIRAVRLRKALK